MKIYTKVEYLWDKDLQEYVEVSAEGYEYDGPVAQAGGGKQRSGGTQVTTNVPWQPIQPYLLDVADQAQSQFQQPTGSQQAPGFYQDAIGSLGGAIPSLAQYAETLMRANQGLAGGDLLSPATNPAFMDYLNLSNQAISRQLNEEILPNLDLGAVATGNVGSSRQGIAQGLAAGRTLDAIARNTAGLTDAAYGRGLTATLGAQSLAPAIAGLSTLPADLAVQQGTLADTADNYLDRLQRERLNAYASLISGGGYGTTSTTGPDVRTGGLTGAIGGGLAGAGIAQALPAGMAAWNPYIVGLGAVAGLLS